MTLPLPPIYLLNAHIPIAELHDLENQIPSLTYDITEAKLVVGKVTTKQRAQLELRSRKVWTEEVRPRKFDRDHDKPSVQDEDTGRPRRKRRRLEVPALKVKGKGKAKEVITVDSSTDSENQEILTASRKDHGRDESIESTQSWDCGPAHSLPAPVMSSPVAPESQSPTTSMEMDGEKEAEPEAIVKVVKLAWLTESLAAKKVLPLDGYVVYEGRLSTPTETVVVTPKPVKPTRKSTAPSDILSRAKQDAPKTVSTPFSKKRYGSMAHKTSQSITRPTHLLHQSTSEHDDPATFPPIPDYLHTTYSCQRPTPLTSPNDPFIAELKKIKVGRILTGDEIGVRAYSTSIATLAAYPYLLKSAQEVLGLPGCDRKVAALYQEWKETGHISAVDYLESDIYIQVLKLFYEIWGVGATTAREFYNKGWRDLDDIIECGWSSLSRVQQIGLKYYDEFQIKIPRPEVEQIGNIILAAANKVHSGWHMVIVGGYRRGKEESGDVDAILSHPDEHVTSRVVQDIVQELESGEWITHTLTLSTANSERGQTPVSWKGDIGKRSTGFDTLDKALVVWQDPNWPSKEADMENNPKAKNPNIHRRVDIILSPWKTAGCAVMGWSGGTTFQRDLRRYAKNVRGLKFDSSGIRRREDGKWVDFESVGGKAEDMLTAEKKVFEGMGLEWREPTERCTG